MHVVVLPMVTGMDPTLQSLHMYDALAAVAVVLSVLLVEIADGVEANAKHVLFVGQILLVVHA